MAGVGPERTEGQGRRELRMTAFPSLGKLRGWECLWEGEHAKTGGEINVVLKALSSFMQAGAAVCGEFRKQKYDSQGKVKWRDKELESFV